MRITNIRYERLHGTLDYDGPLGEAAQAKPIEVYHGFRERRQFYPLRGPRRDPPYKYSLCFLTVETDEGVEGRWWLEGEEVGAILIERRLKSVLIGEDPMATERIWDKMYRQAIHGRKCETMIAMSAIDLALWDLKGKVLGVPVYQLIGGPSRDRIPAYASMLGYSTEPELLAERTIQMVEQGFGAIKWFFSDSPPDGREGLQRNLEMIRTAREAAGPNVELMFDAWNSFTVPYTKELAHLAAPYRPWCFEEPVMPDMIDQYAQLRREVDKVLIAGGEHEYTRWGAKMLLDVGAVDILQMDPVWAGGLSEMIKICALATANGVPVIPHYGFRASTHLIAAQPVTACPIHEWLIQHGPYSQHFLKHKIEPSGGDILLPTEPGFAMDFDEAAIEEREAVLPAT